MENTIFNEDCRTGLCKLPDDSVDCCVTSPPYFGLRDYGVGGQIGLEKSPKAYIRQMVKVFTEVKRILKPKGTLWLIIGDSYAGSGRGKGKINKKGTIIEEIPQFLYFLNKRNMHSKQKSRMWFSPEEIQTGALKKLVEHSLPTVVKEIRERVRQFFFDFEDAELHITPKQVGTYMLSGRYGSYYIIRECKTYLNVDNLMNREGEKIIKTCTYKWKDYAEGADTFEVRTNKHIGQPLVFRRNDFLTDYEIKTLYPTAPPEPVQQELGFSEAKDTPF